MWGEVTWSGNTPPTTCYLLLTTHYVLLIPHSSLLTTYYRSADEACVRQLLRADERLRAPLSTAGGADAAAARVIRSEADAYYATALTRACASGLSAGVRLLLQARADRYGSIYYGSAYLLWLYLY